MNCFAFLRLLTALLAARSFQGYSTSRCVREGAQSDTATECMPRAISWAFKLCCCFSLVCKNYIYRVQSLFFQQQEKHQLCPFILAPSTSWKYCIGMAAPTAVTPLEAFRKSYEKYRDYPSNVVFKNSSTAALKGYRSRLDQYSHKLFQKDNIYVAFREFTGAGKIVLLELRRWVLTRIGNDGGVQREIVGGEAALKAWLEEVNPHGAIAANHAIKKDPKCRYM